MIDVDAYLKRIGYKGNRTPTPELLKALQFAHLTTVPYENLDIIAGVPLSLDADALFDKIVTRRRGGYCFELNELYGQLLRGLGFFVTDYFARFLADEKEIPKRRHHVLGVEIPGREGRWMCDVGVGSGSPNYPLEMTYGVEQWQGEMRYRLDLDAFLGWVVKVWKHGEWFSIFSFTEEPQLTKDFITTSFYCEHAADSPFNKQAMVCLRTATGRNTLDGDTFKMFDGETVTAWEEETQEARRQRIKTMFGINRYPASIV